MKNSKIPAPGKAPKGRGGSDRKLDHPGCGSMPTRPDNRSMNPTAPSGGKAHKSSGGGERKGSYPAAPRDIPTLGGKPPTRSSNSW